MLGPFVSLDSAKVAGLATDLRLSSQQYLTCVTATYILYIVWELPVSLGKKKLEEIRY